MRHSEPPSRPTPSTLPAAVPWGSREVSEPEVDVQVTFDHGILWPAGGNLTMAQMLVRRALTAGGFMAAVMSAIVVLLPINDITVVPGVITPGDHRHTITNIDGAPVEAILVGEGANVTAGQPLILLQSDKAEADVDILRYRLRKALITQARLSAERDGAASFVPPEGVSASVFAAALDEQRQLLNAHRADLGSQSMLVNARIATLHQEIEGYRGENDAHKQRLVVLARERVAIEALLRRGLATRARLLMLDGTVAEEQAALARNETMIAQALSEITAAKIQLRDLPAVQRKLLADEMKANDEEISVLREQLAHAHDTLRAATIRAPASGVVFGITKFSVGQSIAPGKADFDIVPQGAPLVIEARVPRSAGTIRPDADAQVRLALSRVSETLDGRVSDVADAGSAYQVAHVVIDGHMAPTTLRPDTPVDVSVVIGSHTLIGRLFRSVAARLEKAAGA